MQISFPNILYYRKRTHSAVISEYIHSRYIQIKTVGSKVFVQKATYHAIKI